MFAIVDIKGSQERVEQGAKLEVPFMSDKNPGDALEFDKVMLLHDGSETKIGTPILEGITVKARVIEHTHAPGVIAFKKKRRTGYKRKIGHRQDLTTIEILSLG